MVESGHEERMVQLLPNIYQIRAEKPASHVYLIKGVKRKVLIDTGIPAGFPLLKDCLRRLDVRPRDIQLIILTHEHYDHIGAATSFGPHSIVAAHRLAANKIELQDEFVTLMKHGSQAHQPFSADLWLEDGTLVDLGNYRLRVVHTPGHTSGCICVYEMTQGLLFSGDTVFAGFGIAFPISNRFLDPSMD